MSLLIVSLRVCFTLHQLHQRFFHPNSIQSLPFQPTLISVHNNLSYANFTPYHLFSEIFTALHFTPHFFHPLSFHSLSFHPFLFHSLSFQLLVVHYFSLDSRSCQTVSSQPAIFSPHFHLSPYKFIPLSFFSMWKGNAKSLNGPVSFHQKN